VPFVSRRNCSRLNKRRRLCRLRAVTDAAESMEAAVAAAAAAAARDLTNAAAAANEFFVSSPLVRIVASQIDIGDRSSFAGSGKFRIPLLFSGLRRFVYTSCGGCGCWAALMQPLVQRMISSYHFTCRIVCNQGCTQFTLRAVIQDINSAFSPDQPVLSFYSAVTRLQCRRRTCKSVLRHHLPSSGIYDNTSRPVCGLFTGGLFTGRRVV